ncbi:MAG: protein translocase SEC61 complex subunit gamma [Candidatus Kariarchaeaceae archaeon]|jgi:protein translocase SEC61 complex gamma subunit
MGVVQTATRYWVKSKRILLKSTRRPKRKELSITARIVSLGILFIGFIGFIIGFIVDFLVTATG